MRKIAIVILALTVMFGAATSKAAAGSPAAADYKAQLEAALGGTVVGVQRTAQYPPSSLTQILNFTVNRGGRTEVVPVEVVAVRTRTGYSVQSMSIVSVSPTKAIQRTTQLPTPNAETMGGGGGGGGTGTNTPAPSRFQQCMDKCFTGVNATLLDLGKAEACFFACMLGLPIPSK